MRRFPIMPALGAVASALALAAPAAAQTFIQQAPITFNGGDFARTGGVVGLGPQSLSTATGGIITLSSGVLQTGTGSRTPIYGLNGTPKLWDIARGTDAAPVTTGGQQIRILQRQSVPIAGNCGGPSDGACTSPILINVLGDQNNELLVSNVTLFSQSASTKQSADAQPLTAIASIVAPATVAALPAYFEARSYTSTGNMLGIEVSANNRSGVDYCSTASSSVGRCDGIWVAARSDNAGFKLASAVHIGQGDANGKWLEGITVNDDALHSTGIAFRDWSVGAYSIQIRGTHASAAIAVASGAGFVGIGTLTPTALLNLSSSFRANAWAANGIMFRGDSVTLTDATTSGTIPLNVVYQFNGPVLTADNAAVYTDAATLNVNPPTATGSASITNPYAIRAGGSVLISGGTLRFKNNVSAPFWGNGGIGIAQAAASYTDTSSAAGTVSIIAINSLAVPTLVATNPITITDSANLLIQGCPNPGSNVTITNCWALDVVGVINARGGINLAEYSLTAKAWGGNGLLISAPGKTVTDSTSPASTTQPTNHLAVFGSFTLAASNTGVVYTDAATVRIGSAPSAGANVTLTNSYALIVDGAIRAAGLPGTGTAAGSLCIDAAGRIFRKTTAGACL